MLGRSTLLATAGALMIAPAAHAQLPPVPGGLDQVTGLVGALLPPPPAPVQDALDTLLQTGLGALDPSALDGLLGVAAVGGNRAGPTGTAGAAGTVLGAANGVVDGRAPTVTVTVLSHLRNVRKTGRMVVRIASTEPSVVALAGTVRPGQKLKAKKASKKHRAHAAASFRAPIKVKRALLAFKRQGALRVTISLSRSAQKRLGQARDARLSLAVYAVDVARNQATRNLKRHIKR
jgi:hypothetical protein